MVNSVTEKREIPFYLSANSSQACMRKNSSSHIFKSTIQKVGQEDFINDKISLINFTQITNYLGTFISFGLFLYSMVVKPLRLIDDFFEIIKSLKKLKKEDLSNFKSFISNFLFLMKSVGYFCISLFMFSLRLIIVSVTEIYNNTRLSLELFKNIKKSASSFQKKELVLLTSKIIRDVVGILSIVLVSFHMSLIYFTLFGITFLVDFLKKKDQSMKI